MSNEPEHITELRRLVEHWAKALANSADEIVADAKIVAILNEHYTTEDIHLLLAAHPMSDDVAGLNYMPTQVKIAEWLTAEVFPKPGVLE